MKIRKTKARFIFAILALTIACFTAKLPTFASSEVPPALPSAGLPSLGDYGSSSQYSRSYGTLPAAYDSRKKGYITPVRDQKSWGTCWAFGALAAGEASLVKKGLADSSVNLSELHLSYFFFNTKNDPLGNTKNDTVGLPSGVKNYLDSGGNNLFTMFTLAKWVGAASESLVPYKDTSLGAPTLSQSLAYEDTAHLQNARFVSTADIESVKKLIMTYGAVSSALYYNGSYLSDSSAYYYPQVASYNNHIVTLVGWDDNYPTYHFSGSQPSHPGAWIAKNSYGTSYGDGGYFYISYEDKTLCNRKDALSYAFDMEKADNYDHNYQYDGSVGASTLSLKNGQALSNIFTISGNPGGNEKLKAVSFALYTPDVYYSIQVYKNPDPGDPQSGTALFSSPQYGSTTYSGYYTIPLKTQPVFKQGDTFSVVLTFRAKNQTSVSCFVDYTVNTAGIPFTSSASPGQSFYKSGDTWKDMTKLDNKSATARIKAFTSDTKERPSSTTSGGSFGSTTTLSTPHIRTAKSPSYDQAYLSWTAVKGAAGYKVYRSTSPNGVFTRIITTKRTTFTDTKRRTGTTYYYRIRAYKTVGSTTIHSAYSASVRIRVQPAKTSIQKIQLVNNGTKLRLTWKAVPGATGYSVYRSTSKNGTYRRIKIINSGRTNTYLTNLPAAGKAYYYKIRAFRLVNGKRMAGDYSAPKGYFRK